MPSLEELVEANKVWLKDVFNSAGERSALAPYVGKRKLNLGSGLSREPSWKGWINADINPHVCPDVLFDAREPWPFKDETFDTVVAFDVLHLFAGEVLYRVVYHIGMALKVGGFFVGKVPFGATGNPMQMSYWQRITPRLFDRRVYFTYPNMELSTKGWDQNLPMVNWDIVAMSPEDPARISFVMKRV